MDANVAVSRDVLEHLAGEDGLDTSKNFFVLSNGVDVKRLQPSGGSSLRDQLALDDSNILMGMVGNFYDGARKDQMTVCKSLPLVFSQHRLAHFAFIGGCAPGAQQVYDECVSFCVAAGISDRVHFVGKREDISQVLNSLDLFVLSSFQEGLPIAVIEAFMVGLPCILSDIAPLREVSKYGKFARLFKVGDAEDLARQLHELIDDPPSRDQLGAQARQWAMQEFRIETYLANLMRLYAGLKQ
jgi:glycosyltransferase involved in cell wall biosynthesis